MSRIRITISYDGSAFSGYQVQPNKRTVQLELEDALRKMHKGYDIKVTSSGRTDAGVHAIGQVCHFDSNLILPIEAWKKALNALLPDDIHVSNAEDVEDEFHARFSTTGKEYRYKILLSKDPNVFQRKYMYHYPYELDIKRMEEAANLLVGTHDYSSFCAANTDVKDKVRTIYSILISKKDNELTISFKGNGFLYNMVRILVGTLLEVGNGKIKVSEMKEIIEAKNRAKAGRTAPAQGLYLWEVFYS
ncbi:tRNA pseudouridine(38-40) synthase TruA [Lottiidibacillus patelloidae]|uniref:tRNA pseudouridine synthase A n=1 Tax=Lottiidibacillus patelloidae TaxID=2670334 RepID=A0A263BQF1_9BACI|nr:tRNA pseudouridine(38-40) synthase TruA [Lottiidibacillus patelloidae]OZM55934.1 tRNA pseudouridine(38-40) synthase TruA [Lottiidibacillus patelloidae]